MFSGNKPNIFWLRQGVDNLIENPSNLKHVKIMGTSWENIPEIRVHGGDQLQAPDLIRLLLFCQVLLLVLQSRWKTFRGVYRALTYIAAPWQLPWHLFPAANFMSKPLWDKFEQTSGIPLPLFKMWEPMSYFSSTFFPGNHHVGLLSHASFYLLNFCPSLMSLGHL